MVHDVHRMPAGRGYVIEVSVDGAAFVEHWQLAPRGETSTERDISASTDARLYAAGIKFGGREVRLTAHGEEVYVPDLATVRVRIDPVL